MAAAQHDRWALWPPVAMLAGAAWWITAPASPAPWTGPLLLAAPLLALVPALLTGGGAWRRVLVGVLCLSAAFGAGSTVAQVRTAIVAAPRLEREAGPVRLTGWVMDVEPGTSRSRMRVLVNAIDGERARLRYVRLSAREGDAWAPGRAVDCLVLLRPPEGPMAPHGYDFARRAYFQRVGASAISLGRCRAGDVSQPPFMLDRVLLRFAAIRRDLTETITTAIPDEGGAITAAMITGDQSLMASTTSIVFRDSGLGHMLSVSGLHMALAAGGVYAGLHFLLALFPPLALRFPVRKWAAATALLAAFAYLLLSGVSVPAQRAFVMTAIGLGAILLDRPPFTLRALAVALVVVVAIAPESVVDPGFQMSFAATAALIAAFEGRRGETMIGANPGLLLGGLEKTWRNLSDMLLASLVAGLATDPFAIFHFQRFSVYGLVANLVSTPLVTFIVAPAALAAAALAPFGLAEPPLWAMSKGLDLIRAVGAVFAARPEAVLALPAAPPAAFIASISGIVWLCFWRGALRWFGLAGFALAAAVYAQAPRPVVLADGDLRAVVARTSERWVAVGDERRMAFATGRLAGLVGLSVAQAQALAAPDGCTPQYCAWRTPLRRLVVRLGDAKQAPQACVRGAIVLSDVPLPPDFARSCAAAFTADPAELARRGGLALAETAHGLVIRRARDDAGRRPWSGPLRRSGA